LLGVSKEFNDLEHISIDEEDIYKYGHVFIFKKKIK